jgi:hypothetical protein
MPIAEVATRLAAASDVPQLSRLLAAAAAAGDTVLNHLLFRSIIIACGGAALLAAVPAREPLETHLLALGAPRPYVIPREKLGERPTSPMDEEQLTYLQLLADFYERLEEFPNAVAVRIDSIYLREVGLQ